MEEKPCDFLDHFLYDYQKVMSGLKKNVLNEWAHGIAVICDVANKWAQPNTQAEKK